MKFASALVLGFACALPLAASAQWQWIDNTGKKVFSDQPPPVDVPEKNVIRRPGKVSTPRVSVVPSDADAAAPVAPKDVATGVPKPGGVDKELEDKAKKAEEAEKAKRAAETEKIAKAKAENCARARQNKATFDSGIRVTRANAQGEREFLDDNQRAAEVRRAQATIDSDCK